MKKHGNQSRFCICQNQRWLSRVINLTMNQRHGKNFTENRPLEVDYWLRIDNPTNFFSSSILRSYVWFYIPGWHKLRVETARRNRETQFGTPNLFIMGNSKEYWNPIGIIQPKKKVSFASKADASTSIDYEKTNEQFGTKRYGIRNQNEHSRIFWPAH